MIEELVAEVTEYDFKVALETKKPKSWLKSVSAYANSIGGMLLFGVSDDKQVVGLNDAQGDAQIISRLIKERITPLPQFVLSAMKEDGKDVLCLKVDEGRSTPYYYKSDGVMATYIRIGNESIVAPDYVLNELILKGLNRSFDAIITDIKKSDYSFTLLEATYLEQTGIRFEPSDYISFGLADKNGFLTNAGRLMADQNIVYNSRVFCTRWNGLQKGSIFDDALDDKEHKGNLISLLRDSRGFVRNNSKVRFVKEAEYRVDKPDYADRAVFEVLVNALIHRDYIIAGSEIHIDMYDDRLEIQSPGGMFDGKAIQDRDIYTIVSARRNPVIADLFHRMKFMERRGSGLTKILNETSKLPGYTEQKRPEFFSTSSDFRVVLKNMNYSLAINAMQETVHDRTLDTMQDTMQDARLKTLVEFCSAPRARDEMQAHIGIGNRDYFRRTFLKPLLESGKLRMTIPDKPNSRYQKYVTTTAI